MSLQDVKGIGPKGAEKLVANGIATADALSVMRPEEIAGILGVTLKMSKDIILSAKDLMFQGTEIVNADEYDVWLKKTARYIDSGSPNLNAMVGGGWRSMSSIGMFGRFATGKSQICNTAIVTAVDQGYDVCYVETEPTTFNRDRLKEIADNRGLTFDGTKIHLYPATQVGTVYAQMRGYEFLAKTAMEKHWDVALFVVDSFNAKFRRAFAGRETYPARAQEFGRHIDYLDEFSKHFNACIMLTFQVGVTPEGGGQKGDQMAFSIEYYPVGGTLVAHNVNTWISVDQVAGGTKGNDIYEANLVDSSFIRKSTTKFRINERGVDDAE